MAHDLIAVDIDGEDIEGALTHLYAIGLALGSSGRVDALAQEELQSAAAWLVGSDDRPATLLAAAGYLIAAFEQIAQDCIEGVAPMQFTDAAFELLRIRLGN